MRHLQKSIGNVLYERRHFDAEIAESTLKDRVRLAGFQRKVCIPFARWQAVSVGKIKGVKTNHGVGRVGRIKIDEVVAAVLGDRRQKRLKKDRKSTRLNSSHGYISYA